VAGWFCCFGACGMKLNLPSVRFERNVQHMRGQPVPGNLPVKSTVAHLLG
jgi:hypothetical protein